MPDYEQLLNRVKIVEDALKLYIKHIPFVYPQRRDANADGIFVIEIPIQHQAQNSVVFFLPTEASIPYISSPLQENILIVQRGGANVEYKMMEENRNGTLTPIGLGAIVPNRLCLIRFLSFYDSTKYAIVINTLMEEEANLNKLNVTGPATFNMIPSFIDPQTQVPAFLVTTLDLQEIIGRLESQEEKIVIGTEEPEDVLENRPVGTIYLRVE